MTLVKKVRLENYYDRKIYWVINAIISIPLRLSKPFRDRYLWLFSCWSGKRYDDNSRYLYEYVLKFHPEIKAVWITQNKEVFKELQNKNYTVVYADSVQGRKMMLRAGAAFYTNGLDDFSRVCYLYGAMLVHLSHAAAGIKKCGMQKSEFSDSKIKIGLKKIKDCLFNWYHFTFNIATSEISKESKIQTYGVTNSKKVVITGMPRNDLFRFPERYQKSKTKIMEDGWRYILYLPTYRPYENTVVKDLIETLEKQENFINILNENKYRLLIKLHNADRTSQLIKIESDSIILLKNEEVSSTQELMSFTEMLITDYSSCCMDYALTMRPDLIYAPDWELYDELNGIIDLWKDAYKSDKVLKTPQELADKIINIILNKDDGLELNEWINENYEDKSIRGTSYCENVFNETIKRMKL